MLKFIIALVIISAVTIIFCIFMKGATNSYDREISDEEQKKFIDDWYHNKRWCERNSDNHGKISKYYYERCSRKVF